MTAPATPTVAIVIPCYRYAHFLADAVESVVAQTWPAIECVIVDPESPDDTAAVARGLIERYPERDLRLLRQANEGLSVSRNDGIAATTAPLILPLDADDVLLPHAVERMVAEFVADAELAVAHSMGREFGDSSGVLRTATVTRPALWQRNLLSYCSMFTRRAFTAAGGYQPNMCHGYEDWDLWHAILERGGRFAAILEVLFGYRKCGASMLDGSNHRRLWLRARMMANHPSAWDHDALAIAAEVLELGDREPDLGQRLRIIRWLNAQALPGEAVEHCTAALADPALPEDPGIRGTIEHVLGLGLLDRNRYAAAARALRRAVASAPTDPARKRMLALALFRDGQADAAERQLADALELDSRHPQARELTALFGR